MRSLLVTGGAGFIGSNFVLQVLDEEPGTRVINLDKLTYAGNPDNLQRVADDPRYTFVQGDICDRALVTRLLGEHHPNAIVNFAAESHVDRSIDSPSDFITTNVLGTFTLLEASRHAKRPKDFRFLHVSTDEVYGSLGPDGFFTEETRYAPNSPYAASKASADHLVRAYNHTYGLQTITTNCSNNYGPFQFPEKLIPLIILNALEEKPLPIYGDGKNVRDWLYVGDHCKAIRHVLSAGRPGETYNIGGNNEKTNLEVVATLCALLDELSPTGRPRRQLMTFVPDRPGHDRRYAIDAARVRQLGFSPCYTFEQGMRATVEWYLENRAWCERITHRRERLGLAQRSNEGRDGGVSA